MQKTLWTNEDTAMFIRVVVYKLRNKYGGDITLNELVIIGYVINCARNNQPVFLTEATQTLQMPKSSVANTLRKLVKHGVCDWSYDGDDARKKLYGLTTPYRDALLKDTEELTNLAQSLVSNSMGVSADKKTKPARSQRDYSRSLQHGMAKKEKIN
ncbi:MAG: hypothetical protein CMO98_04735 [Woeseia sp.]|nr:hypothetical protein [Woeseia sp.]|tara:strand:+ start:171 stop:638 length:468 start_codon:yes stop_codon:yes gene_type:complete